MTVIGADVPTPSRRRRSRRRSGSRFDLSLALGIAMCALILVVTLLAPILPLADPLAVSGNVLADPSAQHLLGTDSLGRDTLSRVILGARSSLSIALTATAITRLLGTAIGVGAGYLGGRVDWIAMRIVDVMLSLPPLLVAIAVLAAVGAGLYTLLVVLVATYTPQVIRVIRSSALQAREKAYVESAQISGIGAPTIMLRHIVPNIRSILVIQASITVAHMLLVETALSFLGLGMPPPYPNLGFMLAEGRQWMELVPMAVIAPGMVVVFTVAAFTLLGQGFDRVLAERK